MTKPVMDMSEIGEALMFGELEHSVVVKLEHLWRETGQLLTTEEFHRWLLCTLLGPEDAGKFGNVRHAIVDKHPDYVLVKVWANQVNGLTLLGRMPKSTERARICYVPALLVFHEYTYHDTFHATDKPDSLECDGMKFEVREVIVAKSLGEGNPTEDIFRCRFENGVENICWAEEIVATIDGHIWALDKSAKP